MRLRQYLTEITRPSAPIINRIFQRTLPKVYKELDAFDWKFDDDFFAMVMTTNFRKYRIEFVSSRVKPRGKFFAKFRSYNKNVKDGGTYSDASMEIVFTKGIAKRIIKLFGKGDNEKNFSSAKKTKNPIFNDIFDLLAHEWVHRDQALKSKGMSQVVKPGYEDLGAVYHADPGEIEAYAQQAAIEYYNAAEDQEVLQRYLNLTSKKTRKKFLKKFYQYVAYEKEKRG